MGLSNEDSQGGKCVRCDTPVEKKLKKSMDVKNERLFRKIN